MSAADIIAQELRSLGARLAAVEDRPPVGDSFAVPNNLFVTTGGTKVAGGAEQTGLAILENEREPEPSDYHKPGGLEYELWLAEGIITDSIGALPTSGEVTLGGNFGGHTFPYLAMGNGKTKGAMTTDIPPGLSILGGFEKSPPLTGMDLIQLKGIPKAGWKAHNNFAAEPQGHTELEGAIFTSAGAFVGNFSMREGETREAAAESGTSFPADGILYIAVIEAGRFAGMGELRRYEYELTFSEVSPNSFAFGTFTLPEGFLYNVSAIIDFLTKEATVASGIAQLQILCDLEPVGFTRAVTDGELYSVDAGAGRTFLVPAEPSLSLWIPPKQPAPAAGGLRLLKPANLPGNETEVAWTKQTLIIQQMTI